MPRTQYDFEGRWECTRGTSNKFYEIHWTGRHFHCQWGRIGNAPSSIRYDYEDVMKKVNKFRSKGYRQVGRGVRPTEKVVEATPIFEPPTPKARLSNVDETEQIVTDKPKAKKKKEKKFVPTGRLASIE